MSRYAISLLIIALLFGVGIYMTTPKAECTDCNKGKECTTSYDCGEIGVCYCQYSFEEEEETGGGIPKSGTCYFE